MNHHHYMCSMLSVCVRFLYDLVMIYVNNLVAARLIFFDF